MTDTTLLIKCITIVSGFAFVVIFIIARSRKKDSFRKKDPFRELLEGLLAATQEGTAKWEYVDTSLKVTLSGNAYIIESPTKGLFLAFFNVQSGGTTIVKLGSKYSDIMLKLYMHGNIAAKNSKHIK